MRIYTKKCLKWVLSLLNEMPGAVPAVSPDISTQDCTSLCDGSPRQRVAFCMDMDFSHFVACVHV